MNPWSCALPLEFNKNAHPTLTADRLIPSGVLASTVYSNRTGQDRAGQDKFDKNEGRLRRGQLTESQIKALVKTQGQVKTSIAESLSELTV